MANWFATYQGRDWTPQNGYSDLFKDTVRTLRRELKLKKSDTSGLEIPIGTWVDLQDKHANRGVYLFAERFEWTQYRWTGGYITPVFTIPFHFSTRPDMSGVFYSETLVIEFPDNFPEDHHSSSWTVGASHHTELLILTIRLEDTCVSLQTAVIGFLHVTLFGAEHS